MENNIPGAVREAADLNLHGNLILHRWYAELRTPSGLPDYAAITILAEIVYPSRLKKFQYNTLCSYGWIQ